MRSVFLSVICTALFLSTSVLSFGQSDEDQVKQAVNRLFEAMQKADSAGVVDAFWPTGQLQTIARASDGSAVVRNQSLPAFGASVGSRKSGDLDEQITFGAIHIDGALASVWTPYAFFFQQKKSHEGVNSFQLVKINGVWKIQYIIDTRR